MNRKQASGGIRILLPTRVSDPVVAVFKRFLWAFLLVTFVALLVRLDNHDYKDANGDGVSLLDSFYYATVSVTTTGYGDVVPVSNGARLLTSSVVTVARVLFLILLVGTTVEVATQHGRHAIGVRRWRKRVHDHVIICGYGTKGRSAVEALVAQGKSKDHIVVIDTRQPAIEEGTARGLVGVVGDAARTTVLEEAGIRSARSVIVATNDDAHAALITLTARELNPNATIAAAVREGENAHLLRQGGADSVIVSSTASGRLLGMSTEQPEVVDVLEDLLTAGSGMEIYQRPVASGEVGTGPVSGPGEIVIALIRNGAVIHPNDEHALTCQAQDMIVVLQSSQAAGTKI